MVTGRLGISVAGRRSFTSRRNSSQLCAAALGVAVPQSLNRFGWCAACTAYTR
jgi:hypothetical protein